MQVPNAAGALMPGMYAQVDFALPRSDPPLLIPGDTLVVRPDGPQVAVVAEDGLVHFAHIQLGRDFGDRLEVLGGLQAGQRLVVNPGDTIREGVRVRPAAEAAEKGARVNRVTAMRPGPQYSAGFLCCWPAPWRRPRRRPAAAPFRRLPRCRA